MSKNEYFDYQFKVMTLGSSGVGKTSIMNKFISNTYSTTYVTTIGIDFKIKTKCYGDGKTVRLQVWDTAGQERFKAITISYVRGAHAIIVCFDLTDRETFNVLDKWINDINEKADSGVYTVLVGNKADMVDKRVVTEKEALAYAKKRNMIYFETSSKTGQNINELFDHISINLTEKFIKLRKNETPTKVIIDDNKNKNKKCCT